MKNWYEFILHIQGFEYEARADHTYIPANAGKMAFGEKMEPDEPAHVEIYSIEYLDDEYKQIDLPEEVVREIAKEIKEGYES